MEIGFHARDGEGMRFVESAAQDFLQEKPLRTDCEDESKNFTCKKSSIMPRPVLRRDAYTEQEKRSTGCSGSETSTRGTFVPCVRIP